jgi:hypothetical protein
LGRAGLKVIRFEKSRRVTDVVIARENHIKDGVAATHVEARGGAPVNHDMDGTEHASREACGLHRPMACVATHSV